MSAVDFVSLFSISLSPRPHDYSSEGFNDWAFMTTHSWDEDPRGEWTLEIENVVGASDYGNQAPSNRPAACFHTKGGSEPSANQNREAARADQEAGRCREGGE